MDNLNLQDDEFQYAENINSKADLGIEVGRVQKPLSPTIQESTQDVPGKIGNIYTGTDYGELQFQIPITIMSNSEAQYNVSLENMRAALINDSAQQNMEFPLVFGDRPEITYYGHWTSIPTPTFLTSTDWQAQTTLTFTCSSPYGYMRQENKEVVNTGQPITIDGTAPTYPTYTIYLTNDAYDIGFVDSDTGEYVSVGYDVDANNTDDEGNLVEDNMPLVVNEPSANLADWTVYNYAKQSGYGFNLDSNVDVDGDMGEFAGWGIAPGETTRIDKNRHRTPQNQPTVNFGDPKNHYSLDHWYGPLAVHDNVPNPTPDWQIMVNLHNVKRGSLQNGGNVSSPWGQFAMGETSVYLLDESGQRCGMIWIHDSQKGRMPKVGFQLGNPAQNNTVEMVGNGNGVNGDTGPGYVPGHENDKKYKLRIDGQNVWCTLYSLRYYKVAVQNKTPKAKSSTKPARKISSKSATSRASKYKTKSRHEKHKYPKRRKSSKRRATMERRGAVSAYPESLKSSLPNDLFPKKDKYGLVINNNTESLKDMLKSLKDPDYIYNSLKIKKKKRKKGAIKGGSKKVNNDKISKQLRNKKPGSRKYQPAKQTPEGTGEKIPGEDSRAAPSGTHWEDKHTYEKHNYMNYNNSDIFSDFDGDFYLQKIGTHYKCWIQVESYGTKSQKFDQPICVNDYYDNDHNFDFSLASIGVQFCKHNIDMDRIGKNKDMYSHVYADILFGLGSFKYWSILNGGYDPTTDKPKKIAYQGETVTINCNDMKVYANAGGAGYRDLTKYVSFGSTFPALQPNRPNNIDFTAIQTSDSQFSDGNKQDSVNFMPNFDNGPNVFCSYIPRIK